MLLDTSGLLAAIDGSQRAHVACAAAIHASRGPLLLSPFVLAERDHLLGARVSATAQDALLEEVARGAYRLEPFSADDVGGGRARSRLVIATSTWASPTHRSSCWPSVTTSATSSRWTSDTSAPRATDAARGFACCPRTCRGRARFTDLGTCTACRRGRSRP
jgi:hypothetical protein